MKIYTFQQLCEYLQIGKNSLYKLINTGQIKGFKVNKMWRFTQAEIDRFTSQQI